MGICLSVRKQKKTLDNKNLNYIFVRQETATYTTIYLTTYAEVIIFTSQSYRLFP